MTWEGLYFKLQKIQREVEGNVSNILLDAAITVKSEAQRSIQTKKAGNQQTRYDPKRTVTAAAKGNPPNSDKGNLVRSIKARKTGSKEAVVGVSGQEAAYGKHLEYNGWSWLRAALKTKDAVIKEKLKVLGKKFINDVI
jgi:hypothetical protein